jgi:hypothetical protein
VLDDSLATVAHTQLTPCLFGRVAASPDGSRIGVSYFPANELLFVAYDRALTTPSTILMVSPSIETPRMGADATAFWTAIPATSTDLEAASVPFAASSDVRYPLAPFTSMTSGFIYDIVGDGQHAWAV